MMPDQFWLLTYAEFCEMVDGYVRRGRNRRNEMIFQSYHEALFARQPTLPKLEDLMERDEPKQQNEGQTDEEMMAMCKVLNAAFGGDFVEV